MSDQPKVTIVVNSDKTGYGLMGFKEFDIWAQRHIPVWNHATRACEVNGYSEEHRIQMIAYVLANLWYEKMNEKLEMIINCNPAKQFLTATASNYTATASNEQASCDMARKAITRCRHRYANGCGECHDYQCKACELRQWIADHQQADAWEVTL